MHLAAVELTQKAAYAGCQAALVGAGVFVGLLALQALLAAAVVGLAKVLPLWAAALAAGGVLLVVAGVVATKGISSLDHMNSKPSQTLQSVEDNKSWIKNLFQWIRRRRSHCAQSSLILAPRWATPSRRSTEGSTPPCSRRQALDWFHEVKATITEELKQHLTDAKTAMKVELAEVAASLKSEVKAEYEQAKEKVSEELQNAKQKVSEEISEAKNAMREATIGKVEHRVQNAHDTVVDTKN